MRTSIDISEEGATATGEFRPDSDSDTFDFTLRENHPVNITVSVSEEMTRYVTVYFVKKTDNQVVVEFAIPYDFVHPGKSITYTLSKGEWYPALLESVSGHYTLELLPVDPSSPTIVSQQTKATGPYTITIEPIDSADDSSTDISTLLEMSTTATPTPTEITTETLPETETTTEAEPSNETTEMEQPTASVTFNNQTSDGTTVIVESVTMSEGGFVAIHTASLLDGNTLGSVIGVSEPLSAGTYENVEITLFDVSGQDFTEGMTLEESQTLVAMAYLDTNGNEAYDFVISDSAEDGPYMEDSSAVTDSASVTIENGANGDEEPG